MKRHPSQQNRRTRRSGFSLVELLVVIVIIGILMSLILPAISGVRLRARITQVSTEITQLDNGIAKFKSVFTVEPPSSLHIPQIGGTWKAADRAKIRSLWPQFDFATNGGLANGTTEFHLSGAECLVFFLGGLESTASTPAVVLGFSKNPSSPWSSSGTNREGPFYEFDNSRFVDVDGDGFLEYLDSLPGQATPYAYFSSQGRSYTRTNGAGSGLAKQDDFDIHGGNANGSDLSFIYMKTATPAQAHRPDSFQIISPGSDGQYGIGGIYKDGSELIDIDLNSDGEIDAAERLAGRSREADNITNFSGGQLKP